jgi:hypothetical protein
MDEEWYESYTPKYEALVMELLVEDFSAANVRTAVVKCCKRLLSDTCNWKTPSKSYIKRVRCRFQHFEQLHQFIRIQRSVAFHPAHDGSDIYGEKFLCLSGVLEDREGNYSDIVVSPALISTSGSAVHEGGHMTRTLAIRGAEMISDLVHEMRKRGLDHDEFDGANLFEKMRGNSIISDNANGALAASKNMREALYAELPQDIKDVWDEMSFEEQEKLTLMILNCWAHIRHLQEKEGMARLNEVQT